MAKQDLEQSENSGTSSSPFLQRRKIPLEKYFKSLFLFSLIFSLLIFTDYFLPRKENKENIEDWFIILDDVKLDHYSPSIERLQGSNIFYKIKPAENEIALHRDDALRLKKNDSVIVHKTMVFNTVTKIENLSESFSCKPYMNSYGIFILIPVILLITSITGLIKKMKEDWLYATAVIQILSLAAFVVLRLLYL